jgi:hypothetical protein
VSEGAFLHCAPVEQLGLDVVGVHTVWLVQDALRVSVFRYRQTPWALGLGGTNDGAQMQDFKLTAKYATMTLIILFHTLHGLE